ncbi:hypothetical protein Tco_1419787 [Tanacetum coccineum]
MGYSAVPLPHPLIYNRPKKLDLSYSGLDEFKEPEFKGYGPENSKQESNIVCDKKLDESKENSDNSLVKEQVSKDTSSFVESSLNIDKETVFPVDKKVESIKPKGHEKPVKKSIRYVEMYRSQSPRGNQRNWNGQKSNQLGSDFVMYNKACFICGSFNHVQAQCKNHQRERMGKPQQDDTRFVDSGCSRHMTGNIAYLSDFKEFNGGYVTFGGGAHGALFEGRLLIYTVKAWMEGYVGDEAVHKELDDRMERAATTASSLEAEQESGLKLVLPVFVYAVKHMLMQPVQVPAAEESDGFAEIIDFLKASSVHYALTVNPIIYTSCIEQFWATAKVQTVNGVRQLQALVDKKRVIITESSIRRDLHLDDAEGTDCLPTATIFEELARMGYEKPSQKLTFYKAFFSPQWKYFIHTITQCLSAKSTAWNEFSSSMASLIICLATNQKFNLSKYIFDAMVKHLDGGVKFLIKDFSGRITPLFDTMMVQASEEVGEDSDHPTDSTQIPIIDQPSTSSQLKKKQTSKKTQRKEAEVPQDESEHEESVPTPSNDPQPSGEDSMQLTDLMVLCTKLQTQVLDLEKAKNAQAKEIAALKKRVQRLERKKKSRPTGLKRLKKVGMSRRVESFEDQESLGDPEDASKQGRSIANLDKDDDVTLVDESQERQDDELMFDTGVLDTNELPVEDKVDEKDEHNTKLDDSTAGETLQTTTTTTRPKDKRVVVQEPSEFRAPQEAQPSISKDKQKGIMIEPEVPLKRKDQIVLDEQIARDIQAKLDVELIEEEKLARKQEEEANIALIESWENTQAIMEADRLLAERLQSKEREELTDEEKGKLFMKLMEKRRKHFAALRAQEKRYRPPTKA